MEDGRWVSPNVSRPPPVPDGFFNGDGGIRTLDTGLSPYNGLANRRLQPLGHVSRPSAARAMPMIGAGLSILPGSSRGVNVGQSLARFPTKLRFIRKYHVSSQHCSADRCQTEVLRPTRGS